MNISVDTDGYVNVLDIYGRSVRRPLYINCVAAPALELRVAVDVPINTGEYLTGVFDTPGVVGVISGTMRTLILNKRYKAIALVIGMRSSKLPQGLRNSVEFIIAKIDIIPLQPQLENLNLADLREANKKRLSEFKNSKGATAHTAADGSDWSPLEWAGAALGELGELGELANILKKVRRGDLTLDEARESASKELANVLIYLDLLALQVGVDLSAATIAKFNEVSERIGCDVRL